MNITLDQAIVIYARASRSWFGEKAKFKTQERIQQLAAQGDNEGAAVHERVRLHIMWLEASGAEQPDGAAERVQATFATR